MIKILAACGTGINSSQQIKTAIENEMKERGYQVQVDAVVVKDIHKEIMEQYDLFTPITTIKFGFDTDIPVVEAGPILYRIPTLANPVFDAIETQIKKLNK